MDRINLEMFIKAELAKSIAWDALIAGCSSKLDALALLQSLFEDELAFYATPRDRHQARKMIAKRGEQFEKYEQKRREKKGKNS